LKKILIALVLVILIVSSVSLFSAPHVKADTSEAQILSYSWYVAPSTTTQAQYIGDLIVVGEVQNTGTNTLGNVVVGAEAYNDSGGFVGSAQFAAYATYLAPGQKAPFYLDFAPDITTDPTTFDQDWASSVTNVTVRVLYAIDSSQTQYSGLTIPAGSVSNSTTTGAYKVTGTVQNTDDQITGRVWVITTFYNASGTVVGLNYTNYISQSILPGKSATFSATPVDNTAQLSSSITSYNILIQSDPTPIATSTPSPIITPTVQPSTSPTSSNQSTPSPIGISASLIIYLATIAVIVVLVILVVLLLLRRRERNAEFDLPPPPPPTQFFFPLAKKR
jgi:hypothetical protein